MNKLTKRRIAVVAGILFIVLGVGGMRYLSGLKEAPPRRAKTAAVKNVRVMPARPHNVATTLEVQGELAAYDKIDIFSEVTGALRSTSRPFKVGTYFPKGSVLIRVDDEEARLNLLAQKSTLLNGIAQIMPDLKIDYPESFPQWEEYLSGFDPEAAIQPLPEAATDKEKLFVASKNLHTQYYSIKSLEERLDKYSIYAPFSGVLTEALINPGAVVRANQKLGSLMATGQYELVATVPLSDLKYVQEGNKVTLLSDDLEGQWTGTVRRVSDQIDPGSQTVQVFIGLSGKELREGMYLRGEVASITVPDALEIDRQLLVNQNQVYQVENDSLLRLLPVEVVKSYRQSVVVTGVPAGSLLLAEPVAGAFDGMKVKIAETVTEDPTLSSLEK